jgi:hypothetical protein
MSKKKKERIVSVEELQRRLDYFPEVVRRKERTIEEINKVKENFRIGLKDLFNKKKD